MKSSFKVTYGSEKNNAAAFATLTAKAGDVNLKAAMSDATFATGPSLNGLSIGVEKPGAFTVDFDVPKKDFKFKFMNKLMVMEKPLNLNYAHCFGDNRTTVDGTLVFDPANKLSATHTFGTKNNYKFKYTYVHGGVTTFEPSYDLASDSWDFMVSRKVYGDDVVKAAYKTSNRQLGLDWSRNSNTSGSFKISASLNLNDKPLTPQLFAESTWNFEA